MKTLPAWKRPDNPTLSDWMQAEKPTRLVLTAAELKTLAAARKLLTAIGEQADSVNPDGEASDHAWLAVSHLDDLLESTAGWINLERFR